MAARPLNDRQRRFVAEYLIDLNATKAALRAGYSVKSAPFIGHQLLQKTLIAEAIAQGQAERAERLEITADSVLKELASVAFAHMGQFAKWGGESVSLIDSDKVDPRAVSEVKMSVTRYGTNLGIKLHDKLGALKLLGQHLGMFEPASDPDLGTGQVEITRIKYHQPPPAAADAS